MPPKKPKSGRPALPPGKGKVTITLSLLPSTIANLERIVAEQPELDNKSRACDWAVRVATAKGGGHAD